MLYRDRATVCVSCQVGCAVGCAFCATGIGGLTRNLTAGEMVKQTVDAAPARARLGRQLTNLVMMGMGEPLQNYAATMQHRSGFCNDPKGFGFGARRITISTSGIVPRIDALATSRCRSTWRCRCTRRTTSCAAAGADQQALAGGRAAGRRRHLHRQDGRRVSFEYALMGGINDSDEIAVEHWRRCCAAACATSI